MDACRFDRLNTSGDHYSRVFNIDVSVVRGRRLGRKRRRTETSSTRISMTGCGERGGAPASFALGNKVSLVCGKTSRTSSRDARPLSSPLRFPFRLLTPRALSMIERGIADISPRTSRERFAGLRKWTEIDRGKWATLLLLVP